MNLNNIKILNSSTIKYPDKKIIVDMFILSDPLFLESEIIGIFSRAKDKRTYSTLIVLVNNKAKELVSGISIIKGLLDALERRDFDPIRENKELFYTVLEPTETRIL